MIIATPVTVALVLGFVAGVILLAWWHPPFRSSALRSPACARCRYPIAHRTHACPECGSGLGITGVVDAAWPTRGPVRLWWLAALVVLMFGSLLYPRLRDHAPRRAEELHYAVVAEIDATGTAVPRVRVYERWRGTMRPAVLAGRWSIDEGRWAEPGWIEVPVAADASGAGGEGRTPGWRRATAEEEAGLGETLRGRIAAVRKRGPAIGVTPGATRPVPANAMRRAPRAGGQQATMFGTAEGEPGSARTTELGVTWEIRSVLPRLERVWWVPFVVIAGLAGTAWAASRRRRPRPLSSITLPPGAGDGDEA